MVLRLRVSLPDRPGTLGQVARALGVLGADILQVTVLERECGRAVDDFTVCWPGVSTAEVARERLSTVPGVRVEGVWPTKEVPGSTPDYDLLLHVVADPARGLPTLVDALPGLCGAEWAVALAGDAVRHASLAAPATVKLPGLVPLRPAAFAEAGIRLMVLPITHAALHVVVGRREGPPFHRAELDRAARIVEVVAKLADRAVVR